jgi:hypothetical protein
MARSRSRLVLAIMWRGEEFGAGTLRRPFIECIAGIMRVCVFRGAPGGRVRYGSGGNGCVRRAVGRIDVRWTGLERRDGSVGASFNGRSQGWQVGRAVVRERRGSQRGLVGPRRRAQMQFRAASRPLPKSRVRCAGKTIATGLCGAGAIALGGVCYGRFVRAQDGG